MLKVGIVGAGSMGSTHAAAWSHTPVKITGIHALHSDRARQIAESVGAKTYTDFESLLNDVDVIDICTPTHLHHDAVLKAAQAGKHIVCEKPLARSYADGKAMIEACRAAGVHLLVAHVVRFFPEYAQAKNVVDSGGIGQVAVVRLTRCSYLPKVLDNWFMDFSKSGGMILDLMIHDFDYARWIAGEVESVYLRNVLSRNPDAGTDYAIAVLKHTSGALSNIEGGWAYPPPMFRTALEIAGDGGLIEHPANESTPLHVYMKQTAAGESAEVGIPGSPLLENPYTTQIKHFYDVLTGKVTTLRVTPEDGLAALRIALAAIQSAQSGQPVNVSEVQ